MVPTVAVRWCVGAACSVVLLGTSIASAQTLQAWKGPYAGGFVGGGFQTVNARVNVNYRF
jgi:hypothetical protein